MQPSNGGPRRLRHGALGRRDPELRRTPLAAALALGLAACSPPERDALPLRVSLLERVGEATWQASPEGARDVEGVTFERDSDGLPRVTATLPAESWIQRHPGILQGFWSSSTPLVGSAFSPDGSPAFRLLGPDGPYRLQAVPRRLEAFAPGSFVVRGSRIVVRRDDDRPPGELRLEYVPSAPGEASPGAGWRRRTRFAGSRFTCDALVVGPGERLDLPFEAPPGGLLRFATVHEPGLRPDLVRNDSLAFRVFLDDEELFARSVPADEAPSLVWNQVRLPAGRTSGRLGFEVSGPFARTAFAAPGIFPSSPPPSDRPDLVLFLADTFRADNLGAYGSELGLTPNLDAFSRRARVFTNAYSTASFTLPAHASLFTGLHPREAGILGDDTALARGYTTVARVLSDLGYRTAAVTDGLFVSRLYGLDQGFEVFDELHSDLDSTLARVERVLEADDGRPLFLFVQTYRTHMPYEVSDEVWESLEGQVEPPGAPLQQLTHEFASLEDRPNRTEAQEQRMQEVAAVLEESYLATVHALDRGFARFQELLERRKQPRYLVFTSDHGEAFGEHDDLFHGGPGYEEVLRVPLLLAGPGVATGPDDAAASLVDVPRTLAQLARASAPPAWRGSSLLALPDERVLLGFECSGDESSTLTLISGERKVFVPATEQAVRQGEVEAAYDLARDPGETDDLSGRAAWPRELLGQQAERLLRTLEPRRDVRVPVRDSRHVEALRAMGYAGED